MEEQKGGLLLVMAHPDDESMGSGGLVLRHTRAGIATHLICATYGEQGWNGKPKGARKEDLAEIRAKELEEAAAALALSGVELWDYPDGGVSQADHPQITHRITEQIAKLRPRAVVGWGPDGGYGHPDHIWIGACTDAAIVAMDEAERPALYHLAVDQPLAEFYREAMRLGASNGGMTMQPQDNVDIIVELVRHVAKAEAPLAALAADRNIISTIATITFYGKDQAGNNVIVTGQVQVNFGNFADPT